MANEILSSLDTFFLNNDETHCVVSLSQIEVDRGLDSCKFSVFMVLYGGGYSMLMDFEPGYESLEKSNPNFERLMSSWSFSRQPLLIGFSMRGHGIAIKNCLSFIPGVWYCKIYCRILVRRISTTIYRI